MAGGKGLDFKHKEVINITDGRRLRVCAGCYSRPSARGVITSIIVPGSTKMFGLLAGGQDITIPWDKIKCIGDDVILVEI